MGESSNKSREEQVLEASSQLRRVARGLLYDSHSADDVVQDAWVASLRKERQVGWDPRAWFSGAVRNLSLSKRREEARRIARERKAAKPEALISAASAVERLEVTRRVMDAVEALEEPYRSVILLRFFDDLAPREIARREGVPVNTVRTWVRRGLEHLRRDLDPDDSGDRLRFLGGLAPLAGASPWPITLGLPTGSWQLASKCTGGIAMGKAVQWSGASVVALLVAWIGAGWLGDNALPAVSEHKNGAAEELAALTDVDQTEPKQAEAAALPMQEHERSPVRGNERSFSVRGFVFRGYSDGYPDVPLLAELHTTEEAGAELLLEERLVSGADGAFVWDLPVPEQSVTISITPVLMDHIVYTSQEFVVLGDPAPQNLEIRAHPLDITVVGRVVDSQGAGIRDATVGTYQDRDQALTDKTGSYRLSSCSTFSSINVYARADGFAAAKTKVRFIGGAELAAEDIVLGPELRILGRVSDENGLPVIGARVTESPLAAIATQTDDSGYYEMTNLDPEDNRLWVLVEAEGFARAEVEVTKRDSLEIVQDVTLVRGSVLRGRVTDSKQRVIEGARLTLGYSPDSYPRLVETSNSEGAYEFPAVGAGEQLLWVERAGFATRRLELVVPEQSQIIDFDVELSSGSVVAGRIVDEEGEGVPHVPLSIARRARSPFMDDYIAPRTRTDAEGRFRMDQLPSCALEVTAFPRGYVRERLELSGPGQEDVEIVLQRAGVLSGQVIDGLTGEPLNEFTVRFVDPHLEEGQERMWGYDATWSGPGMSFVDTNGRWAAREQFRIGEFVGVEVSADGYAPTVDDHVRVRSADEEGPVFVMQRGSRISGQVIDGKTNQPLAGVLVRRFNRATRIDMGPDRDSKHDRVWEATTDEAGRFELEGVPAGETRLGVAAPDFATRVDGPFDVLPGGDLVEREIRLAGGGVITGVLLDIDGTPLAQETITLNATDVPNGERTGSRTTTDESGRFRLAGLQDGLYQVNHRDFHADHGFNAQMRAARITDADEVEIELRPLGTARVEGSVVAEVDLPELMTLWISPRSVDRMEHAERLRRSRGVVVVGGRFVIEGLEAGDYNASVDVWSERHHLTGSTKFEISEHGTLDLVIDLKEY